MTDTFNSDETVTPEDLAASQDFDLRTLGIDPSSTPIASLCEVYRTQAAICNEYAAKLKSGASDPTDVSSVVKAQVKKTVGDRTNETVSALRDQGEKYANAVFSNGFDLISSATMLEEVENLVSLMRDEYQYHLNAAIQAEKDARGIKSTPAEEAINAKLACIKLKGTGPKDLGLIGARLAMAKAMEGIALPADEMAKHVIPDNLYKTGGIRGGFNTDVLPRLPRLDLESSEVSGSPSTHLVFRFKAVGNDEAVDCREVTLNDVAHNVVSQGAYRITGKDISRELKAKGLLSMTETEWSLEFKSGTLYGKLA